MFLIILNTKNIETFSYCFGIFINCDQKYALQFTFQAFYEKFKNWKRAKYFDNEKAKRFVFVHLEVRGEMVTLRTVENVESKILARSGGFMISYVPSSCECENFVWEYTR